MGLEKELEQAFDTSYSFEIQEAFLKALFSSYKMAFHECSKFDEEEAHDLRPFYRWIQFRKELRGVGNRFRSLESIVEPNGSASSYHIVIDSDHMMLTASSVSVPGILPRASRHRVHYANECNLDLFKREPIYDKIYAVLTHGAAKKEQRQPGFAQIIFPGKGFESYIHKIDLFERFHELVKSLSIPKEETSKEKHPEIKEQKPTIKRNIS